MAAPWWDDNYHELVSGREYRVYVRNLPWSVDGPYLTDAFDDYGAVHSEVSVSYRSIDLRRRRCCCLRSFRLVYLVC
ncbi:hypothetical protein GUJ93_ZPchr0005g16341 [Zizania palustris]|uniref:RRM domain-containing protein n=1 Tax=Zizania palustris TaxID=103762 RepID=A0A8J5S2Q8_ZIZPA|nr:hypothetical protein GUJ93_ZPchr0005g16341 [Zizania palustris]